jgi:hypothetical protein
MTVYVDSMAAVPRELDIVSPELALVDPELGQAARARLADLPGIVHPQASPAPIGTAMFGRRVPSSLGPPVREGHSRRLLVGVAAATMLALVLFDVRVEVGERPAVAESNPSESPHASSVGPVTRPSSPTTASRRPPDTTRKLFRATDRRFAWAPVPGASGYHVEFFRGSARVFADETTGPLLTVPAEWSLDGSRRSLRPGTYRWYVWPIVGDHRQSHAVVQATLSIP